MFAWAQRRLVNLLGAIALVIIAGRTIALSEPEFVPWGAEVGQLAYDFSLAYAGGWAFHWLVIVRPRAKVRKSAKPRIESATQASVAIPNRLWSDAHSSGPLPATLTKADVERICAAVSPHSSTSWGFTFGGNSAVGSFSSVLPTWAQYMAYELEGSARAWSGVVPFFPYLDEEVVAQLSQLDALTTSLSQTAEFLRSMPGPFTNWDFGSLSDKLWEYYQAGIALKASADAMK